MKFNQNWTIFLLFSMIICSLILLYDQSAVANNILLPISQGDHDKIYQVILHSFLLI